MLLKSSSTPPPTDSLEVAGLFAGVGGFELGFAKAGLRTSILCEIDPPAREVLRERFPAIPLHEDVITLDSLPPTVDLLAGGFPCQDLSQAGRTAGLSGPSSSLVSEIFRLLRARAVPLVVLENVPFMLQLAKGRALEVIVAELEALGYRWAYRVIDTRAFGLPQRRLRVFLVAALKSDPREILLADDTGPPLDRNAAKGTAFGFYWTEGIRGLGWAVDAVPTLKGGSTIGIPSPPAILLPSGELVTPHIKDAERLQGFPPDWTLPAERAAKKGHRWKLVGNAVTVDVAKWLGTRLLRPGSYNPGWDLPLLKGGSWPFAAWNVGDGRFRSNCSPWPVREASTPLDEFLRFPTASLSERATSGFLARARSSSLRFPDGFLASVERHLESVRREAVPA